MCFHVCVYIYVFTCIFVCVHSGPKKLWTKSSRSWTVRLGVRGFGLCVCVCVCVYLVSSLPLLRVPPQHTHTHTYTHKTSGWEEEAANIEQLANTLSENCEHFEMPIPTFEGLDPLKEDISKVGGWMGGWVDGCVVMMIGGMCVCV